MPLLLSMVLHALWLGPGRAVQNVEISSEALTPKVRVGVHSNGALVRRHTTLEQAAVDAANAANSAPRRGSLRPPAPALAANASLNPESSLEQGLRHRKRSGKHLHNKKTKMRSSTSNYRRKSAEGWKFRGPKAFPILHDQRFTKVQKEHELERLMEKLHAEFFLKQAMGHLRLPQAHAAFYETVADFKQLTGKPHPANFHFEALPELPAHGAAELEVDDDEEPDLNEDVKESDLNDDVVLVPETPPGCMENCKTEDLCGDPASWTNEQACKCFKSWQTCSLEDINGQARCPESVRDTDGFFFALESRKAEVCSWENGKMYEHLNMDALKRKPGNATEDDDEDGYLQSLLESGAAPERVSQSDSRGTYSVIKADKESKDTRAYQGCKVSVPEMLGDGHCDGGAYNTEACNYDGGDCCESDCRPAMHHCGVVGYQCQGTRKAAQLSDAFQCRRDSLPKFRDYIDKLRDQLTHGSAMISAKCTQLSKQEHNEVAQAFNNGVFITVSGKKTKQASAIVGGPSVSYDCDLWDNEMGSDWFGAITTHEMGHISGYQHPKFKNNAFASSCENIGSTFCAGHCQEWTSACETHLVFGSDFCGFANTGCKTTCVHSDYCMSLPERLTECFGYQKVHSRGENTKETVGNTLDAIGIDVDNPLHQAGLVLALLTCIGALFICLGCCLRKCCFKAKKKAPDTAAATKDAKPKAATTKAATTKAATKTAKPAAKKKAAATKEEPKATEAEEIAGLEAETAEF